MNNLTGKKSTYSGVSSFQVIKRCGCVAKDKGARVMADSCVVSGKLPSTLNPEPCTLHPELSTLNPKP